MSYKSKGTIMAYGTNVKPGQVDDVPRSYDLAISAENDEDYFFIMQVEGPSNDRYRFYYLCGVQKEYTGADVINITYSRVDNPSVPETGFATYWAYPTICNNITQKSGNAVVNAVNVNNAMSEPSKCYTNVAVKGNVMWRKTYSDKGDGYYDNCELTSYDIPIYTYDATQSDPCSILMSKLIPYLDKGDTEYSDNARELNTPNIAYHINLDADSQTFYFNWKISGENTVANQVIKLLDIEKKEVEMWEAPTGNTLTLSKLYVQQVTNRTSCFFRLYGENQDENLSYVEVEVYLTQMVNDAGETVIPYHVTREISQNKKNTLTVNDGEPSQNEGYDSQPDDTKPTDTNNDYSGINNLTTTYMLSNEALQSLGNWLWSQNFIDALLSLNASPLENIVSVKAIPYKLAAITESSRIKIGNSESPIAAPRCTNVVAFESNEILIPSKLGNFLDYDGFTSISLYVPFIGIQSVSASMVVGFKTKLRYIIDVVTGSFTVCLYSNINKNWTMVDSYSGNIGIDIPITASNRAQLEVAHIEAGVKAIGDIATKNVVGGAGDMINGMLTPFHSHTKGSPSSLTASLMTSTPYYTIVRPRPQVPTSYGKNVGYVCGLTKKLSDLKGYTVCENPNLDDINCSLTEKENIYRILTTGFYIK